MGAWVVAGMTNGFSVDPGALAAHAEAITSGGARVRAVAAPVSPSAGRSTHEVAAAIAQLLGEARAAGVVLSDLGAALAEAAAAYAEADDVVARTLGGW